MKVQNLFFVLIVFALALPQGVQAQNAGNQVVFSVPVQLYELHPDVMSVSFRAYVDDDQSGANEWAYIGRGTVQRSPDSNGTIEEVLEIVVTLEEGKTTADVRCWMVEMFFTFSGPNGTVQSNPSTYSNWEASKARDDRPFNPGDSGVIGQ